MASVVHADSGRWAWLASMSLKRGLGRASIPSKKSPERGSLHRASLVVLCGVRHFSGVLARDGAVKIVADPSGSGACCVAGYPPRACSSIVAASACYSGNSSATTSRSKISRTSS